MPAQLIADDLHDAICNHVSPGAVAMAISYLQLAQNHSPSTEAGRTTQAELKALTAQLMGMLGIEEYNALLDELGL